MTRAELYVEQMRRFFDVATDPILCRAVLARHSIQRGNAHHFINAWDRPRRSY